MNPAQANLKAQTQVHFKAQAQTH